MGNSENTGKKYGSLMYTQHGKIYKLANNPGSKVIHTEKSEAVLIKTSSPFPKTAFTKVSKKAEMPQEPEKSTEDKPVPEATEAAGLPEAAGASETPQVLSDWEVLQHTASLWKYKPVPKDEPEPYEEYLTESATLGSFHVTAARVRGKKHKHEGTNCDDWFETRNIENFAVIAVSDGAGSKKFSRIGAKTSCTGAMEYLERELKNLLRKNSELKAHLGYDLKDSRFQQAASQMAQMAQHAMLAARQNVINAFQARQGTPGYAEAVKRDLQLNDFAATLLLTIALPIENSDETFIVTCQVGDGMTAAISRTAPYDQIITLLGDADSGAFSGETEFLTSSSIDSLQSLMGRTRVSRKKIDIIMSMTDGVADDYDPNGKEMLRLYLDLLVNRVISSPQLEMMQKKLDKARYEELSKIVPAPQSYPAVTGELEPRMVPVQYVRELQEKQGLDLKKIWEEGRESLTVMAGAIQLNTGKNAATRLKEWLDSYVVRGSFDDRTLVILQRGE
ncbi:PP2C family serine/threonine-protein phosphatase [Selenomonas bovis]|uniref:PP2C family serine/threonine-protein phosphatase n=1 Tax=Selenomonas bovis TaxID=416586 RepID=UPI000370BFF9|nr:PP2C family serine/threonine-protein phosphatase [Selenomonas bovis]